MTGTDGQTPGLHALLIGIDFYAPATCRTAATTPASGTASGTSGHVEAFLRTTVGVPAEHITKLTAAVTGAAGQQEPAEPRDRWPTYSDRSRRTSAHATYVSGASPAARAGRHEIQGATRSFSMRLDTGGSTPTLPLGALRGAVAGSGRPRR